MNRDTDEACPCHPDRPFLAAGPKTAARTRARRLLRAATTCLALAAGGTQARQEETNRMDTVYDFAVTRIDGTATNLAAFRGRVLLIVNVASRCGFTGQYAGLQKLQETHGDRGLVVLGFPANDFLGQEPGTNAEIAQFCSSRFHVTFPLFEKITVKGDGIHPLYRFLTDRAIHPRFGGPISWNFNKFLVGRDGRVVARFGSRTKPEDPELTQAVEAALEQGPAP